MDISINIFQNQTTSFWLAFELANVPIFVTVHMKDFFSYQVYIFFQEYQEQIQ